MGPVPEKEGGNMNNKLLKVYVTDSTLSTIKKRAVLEGKTASKFLRELLASVLDHPTESIFPACPMPKSSAATSVRRLLFSS